MAKRWVTRWQARMNMSRRVKSAVLALTESPKHAKKRVKTESLGGGARNAIAKSLSPKGEDGVTMIAGKGDFSSTRGLDRSRGGGIKV